jgi:hypothetical protein
MAVTVQLPVPLPGAPAVDRTVRRRGAQAARPDHRGTVSSEDLIGGQVTATRVAGKRITGPALELLLDSVDRACCLPARPGWEHKAVAHAEIFSLLDDVAGRPAAPGRARLLGDLMCTVGPVADGMITSSRRRLLGRLRAGDAEGAALEMENHLRTLHYMCRLARIAS